MPQGLVTVKISIDPFNKQKSQNILHDVVQKEVAEILLGDF